MTEDQEPRLIANRWQCPDGTVLQSMHRYDYVNHKDALTGEECFVDGGTYGVIRTSGNLKNLCVYSNDPHEDQREFFRWGTYGIDGKQPRTFIAAKDMTTEHIEAVIETQDRIAPEIKELFLNELEYRKELNALHCTQTKSIEIQVFTTPKGDKTCSTDPKENCLFLQSTRFGLEYTCCTLPIGTYLNRYEDEGNGYLKPHEECIVWKE